MALKNLSVEEMVNLSGAWVTSGNEAHRALAANGRLSALVPDLSAAHEAIHAVAPRAENPRLAEIARLASEQDTVHDRLARGIHGLLTELSLLDERGDALLDLRDTLFPDGLAAVIRATYRGEAGFASLLRQRLSPELRSELESIVLRQGNLLGCVEAWLAAGDQLGVLEEERARIEGPAGASLGVQTVTARNRWIRVVNAFSGLAALVELDPATERTLFGPLRDAEKTADLRAARRNASKSEGESGASA